MDLPIIAASKGNMIPTVTIHFILLPPLLSALRFVTRDRCDARLMLSAIESVTNCSAVTRVRTTWTPVSLRLAPKENSLKTFAAPPVSKDRFWIPSGQIKRRAPLSFFNFTHSVPQSKGSTRYGHSRNWERCGWNLNWDNEKDITDLHFWCGFFYHSVNYGILICVITHDKKLLSFVDFSLLRSSET